MVLYALGAMETLARDATAYGLRPDEVAYAPAIGIATYSPKSPAGQRAAEEHWEQQSLEALAQQLERERAFNAEHSNALPEKNREQERDAEGDAPAWGVVRV
ncbi:MAG: hypothetical protein IT548_18045 [Alphaproteobacteria bacterium]|nr:hypothetical protein [Alphaproteobacteria bacterium]